MRNIEFVKSEIKANLPSMVVNYNLARPRFNEWAGGEFSCPVCGHTLKAYINSAGNWSINPLGNCSDFGSGGYYCDSFGLYAAVHGIGNGDAFKALMTENGITFSGVKSSDSKMDFSLLAKKKAEREQLEAARQAARDGKKARNCQKVLQNTIFGYDMPKIALDLLFSRGIDILQLPEKVVNLIGYVNCNGLESLDSDSTYSIEGIVFKLNDKACQIRRTIGNRFIGKNDKMSRFQTFGLATPLFYQTIENNGDPLFITEGPFDALALYAAGAKNVIATLGASNHNYILSNLKQMDGGYLVCYDPDDAGQKNGLELVNALNNKGCNCALLPVNGSQHDANDLLQSDPDKLTKRIYFGNLLAKNWLNHKKVNHALDVLRSCDLQNNDYHFDRLIKSIELDNILLR